MTQCRTHLFASLPRHLRINRMCLYTKVSPILMFLWHHRTAKRHLFFIADTQPISHRVGRSISPSVGLSHFAFFAFLGILRVGKFVFEHAPAQIMTAPAQIITAPAQPPATGAVVYTALLSFILHISKTLPGDVEQRDTDRSKGKDTGFSQKERFSLFFLSRDFHRVLGVGLGLS